MSGAAAQQHRNLIGARIADGRLEFVSLIGLGAYGAVYLARDLTHVFRRDAISTKAKASHHASFCGSAASGYYAVKCLNKIGLDNRQRMFQRRETLLHTMASPHPSVVTLYRIIDNPWDPHIYVILDYCPDGDLFSMITEKQRYALAPEPYVRDPAYTDGRPLPEDPAYTNARLETEMLIKDVFDQLLDAVEYCHRLGIYHRDLKPENVLCCDKGRRIALTDFGLATGERMSSDFGCGSSFYMGPECQGGVVTRLSHYNSGANDVWSLGVIFINFICARNPWKQATPNDDTFREFLRDPNFIMRILPVTAEAHAILRRIFTLRPENRCTVSDLRRWVRAVPRMYASNMELWQRHVQLQQAKQLATSIPKEVTLRTPAKADFSDDIPCDRFSQMNLHVVNVAPKHSNVVVSATPLPPDKLPETASNRSALQSSTPVSARKSLHSIQTMVYPTRNSSYSSNCTFRPSNHKEQHAQDSVPTCLLDGSTESSPSASEGDFVITPVSSQTLSTGSSQRDLTNLYYLPALPVALGSRSGAEAV